MTPILVSKDQLKKLRGSGKELSVEEKKVKEAELKHMSFSDLKRVFDLDDK